MDHKGWIELSKEDRTRDGDLGCLSLTGREMKETSQGTERENRSHGRASGRSLCPIYQELGCNSVAEPSSSMLQALASIRRCD
jgi:hypothetical protein